MNEKELEKIEKYDYFREYLKKSKNSLPYNSVPLTKFEKIAMKKVYYVDISDKAKSYADIPISSLKSCINCLSEGRYNSCVIELKELVNNKNKNFSEKEIKEFLRLLRFFNISDASNKLFRLSKDEKNSVLDFFSKSKYYIENKEKIKKYFERRYKTKLEECCFDKNDMVLFIATVFKSIPDHVNNELENRKKFLDSKKSRDESDFIRMSKKMKEFYEKGEFAKGDELLHYYTHRGDRAINGAARHNLSIKETGVYSSADSMNDNDAYSDVCENHIISEDLFLKTVIELEEIKKRIKKSDGVNKALWEKLVSEKYLYRGLSLGSFLKTIQGEKLSSDLSVNNPGERDKIIKYLIGKISIDPAVLSTSLNKALAIENFTTNDEVDVLLQIDITKYKGGMDIQEYSRFEVEEEVILSPGTKLKIKSVTYDSEHKNFEVSCIPV